MIFGILYGILTLLTGTLFGVSHPVSNAVTTALVVAIILAGVFFKPRARLGRGADIACLAFVAIAFLTAAFAICPLRSVHQAVQFAAAAVLFYLVLDSDPTRTAPPVAAVGTLAALIGLSFWLIGITPRVVAPFVLHHYAGGFLALHIPITWRLARQRPRWYAAVAIQIVALAGTFSLAAGVALGAMILWSVRRRVLWVCAAAAVLIGIAILIPRTSNLLTKGADPTQSTENRVRYLRTGLTMLEVRPLGWGLGSVPLASARYRPQTPDVMPQGECIPHLHNLPLNIAVETGVAGLAAAIWFLWRAGSLNLVPYLIVSLAAYQFDLPALIFAAAVAAGISAPRREDQPMPGLLRIVLLGIAALAPFGTACGWDAFLSGDYIEAARTLPDVMPLSGAAGAELLQAGQAEAAIPFLQRATELDPYFTLAWFHLGRAQERLGQSAVNAYAQAMLTQPITIFAPGWNPQTYSQARQQALEQLSRAPLALDSRTQARFRELRAFLTANPSPPEGVVAVQSAELIDSSLDRSISLLVFFRLAPPRYTTNVDVLLPAPGFYIPPGIGYLRLQQH